MTREAWMLHAACRNVDLNMFFETYLYPRAKAVCERCPVRMKCLRYGLYESAGVWGGLTPGERKALVRGGQPSNLCPSGH